MALQGFPIKPADIDLQTDKAGAYRIQELLMEYMTRQVIFSTSARMRSHLGKLLIEDIVVEIIGNLEKLDPYDVWHASPDLSSFRRWVQLEGMKLPVLDLDYEAQAYEQMGRIERARELRTWLERVKNGNSC